MNPFRPGSAQHRDFEIMSDCRWHCTKCELSSGQAKTWQLWRQDYGLQLDGDGAGNWHKWIYCPTCQRKTIHRKLLSVERTEVGLKSRAELPKTVKKRIKDLFGCVDEYTNRTEHACNLEIDHRIPQVRWKAPEGSNLGLTDAQLREKFMLLTRPNNLLKSRACEECVRTGKRAPGYREVPFWYAGGPDYTEPLGCVGCFWYSPAAWRAALTRKLREETQADGNTDT